MANLLFIESNLFGDGSLSRISDKAGTAYCGRMRGKSTPNS